MAVLGSLLAAGVVVVAYALYGWSVAQNAPAVQRDSLQPSACLASRFFVSPSTRLWLHVRNWLVPEPRAKVVLFHGYGEFSSRYERLAHALNQASFSVYSFDQQGHGLSEGDRGYFERFEHLSNDSVAFARSVRDNGVRVPTFVVAHSMGGLVAMSVLEQIAAEEGLQSIGGVVLSGALLRAHADIATPTNIFLSELFSRWLPKLPIQRLDPLTISVDQDNRGFYVRDPAVFHGAVVARVGNEFLHAMERVRANANTVRIPALIMHGADDTIVDPTSSSDLKRELPHPDVTVRILPGLRHEVLFEGSHGLQLHADIVQWLHKHL
jgi:acylglycerol lipase